PIPKPTISTNQNFSMPRGSEAWISAYLAQSKSQVGVYLTFAKGVRGEQLYAALEKERAKIDKALGLPVAWGKAPDGRLRVIAVKSFPGSLLNESRKSSQAWLADAVQRFVSVFRPRIDALLRDAA